ncbi:MAG: YlxR family protein [Actinobacteria bacterium]|nr:YlxR family protein [Propionicimonas sp.]MBU3976181.1 YlxR family protein [Actinomycetota bacterium]MBU3985576.1 YlxR family protein [Actinomycetota bacterium]MBU4008361.1 YlxR family protein [Actinomycetota bacterium]MBU4066489.1 YlxR family protein [Actinomycetota bacterium]
MVGAAWSGLDSQLVEPQRTCIGCRQRGDKSGLLRLVWSAAEGAVLVDVAARLPGRGCYLHPSCAAVALQRRAVGRALKVGVDPEQVALVLAELTV